MKSIFLLLYLLMNGIISAQERDTLSNVDCIADTCSLHVYFEEYGYYFSIYRTCDTIIRELAGTDEFISIILYNCMGESYLEHYDSDSNLLAKGYYSSSLDTLKSYVHAIIPRPPYDENIVVIEYFQPLKNGPWWIWDKEHNEFCIEYWKMGIRKETYEEMF